jgi:hypothetical protein
MTADWRIPDASQSVNHCTEFVSAALYAGGMPSDRRWWPFWAAKKGSLSAQLTFVYHLKHNKKLTASWAWVNYKKMLEYFSHTTYASTIELDPRRPGSAYEVGANVGDVIIYDWSGVGDLTNGHVAIVTDIRRHEVLVTQQGRIEKNNQMDRDWEMSELEPGKRLVDLHGNGAMKAWLLHWVNNPRG